MQISKLEENGPQMNREFASTVVSIVPFEIVETKPGLYPSRFKLKACQDIEEPSILHVSIAHHFLYLDVERGSIRMSTPSIEVARSVVEDFVAGQLRVNQDCKPGIFYVPGYKTVEEVKAQFWSKIQSSNIYQNNWFRAITNLADDDWKKYHQHTTISDFQRLAAERLGLRIEDHEWMGQRGADTSDFCPACGNIHQKGIVICPSCKCVLDTEKYNTLQFA